MKKLLLIVAAAMSSSGAFAADGISLGSPAYGGNGCPAGSASAILSPDGKTLTILFDKFQTMAGRPTNLRLDRKSCNIAVPVHVPQGYSISLFHVDYRGFNSLPHGASSTFNVEYFFAGQVGPKTSKTWNGYVNQDYTLSQNVVGESLVWSPCGKDTNLRVNSSMTTKTNSSMEEALSTVDSSDINAGLIYHVQWKRCN